jgi:hypothetical protein
MRRNAAISVLALSLLLGAAVLASPSVVAPPAGAVTNSNQTLASGQQLSSGQSMITNGYELIMQTDGNLVEYYEAQNTPIWQSGTVGNSGAYAVMQSDGNFVVDAASGASSLWSTNTSTAGAELVLQTDGNVVIYSDTGSPLWNTDTENVQGWQLRAGQTLTGGDSLVSPNQKFKLTMQTDGNLVLYAVSASGTLPVWASGTARAFGTGIYLTMQSDDNLVVDESSAPNTLAIWSSGTNTATPDGDFLAVQSNGLIAIYSPTSDTPVWSINSNIYQGAELSSGQTLAAGQFLESPSGQYVLSNSAENAGAWLFQTAYPSLPEGYGLCPMWAAPSTQTEVTIPAGSSLTMQTDGNLVLSSPSGAPIWASNTNGNPGAYLSVQNDGNLVIYPPSGTAPTPGAPSSALWASGTADNRGLVLCPGDTLQRGQYLESTYGGQTYRTIMQTDCNLVTYDESNNDSVVWASGTSTNQAPPSYLYLYDDCYTVMQSDGNLVIYAPEAEADIPSGSTYTGTPSIGADGSLWSYASYYDQPVHNNTIALLAPNAYLTIDAVSSSFSLTEYGSMPITPASGAAASEAVIKSWAEGTAKHVVRVASKAFKISGLL